MSSTNQPIIYTPEQVAKILQLSRNTVYALIKNGEIKAKKIGRVYRIPAASISFVFKGLDSDLYELEQEDINNLSKIKKDLSKVRSQL